MPAIEAPPAAAPPAAPPAAAPPSHAPPDDRGQPTPWMDDVGADLDALDAAGDTPPEPPPDKPPKPAPDKPPKPSSQTLPKPDAAAAAPPAPEDKTPSNIKDLRKGYEEKTKRIREHYEPEITRLTAKVQELEKTPAVTQTKEQQERFKFLEERNKALEQEMRYVNYRKSTEYQEKHQKPMVAAWEKARRDLAQVEVNTGNGQTRQATDADLVMLAQIDSPVARLRKANEMFVDSGDVIAKHADRIADLADAQEQAEASILKEAEGRTQKQADDAKTEREARITAWKTANKDLADRFPKWFGPVQGDTDGNTLLEKGFALADLRYEPTSLTPERLALLPKRFRDEMQSNNGQLTQQGVARLDALIRNKVANHDRLAARTYALDKELAEAKAELAQYEDSAPPGGGNAPGGGAGGRNYMDDPNAEIDKLDNPNLT